MTAQIQHVGGRPAKVYVTPASAHVHGNGRIYRATDPSHPGQRLPCRARALTAR